MTSDTDIAVVGVGCRYPDAWTPQQFWQNIDSGRVAMRPLAEAELTAAGFTAEQMRAPNFVGTATSLPGVDQFAAEFFGYSPRDAELMDPQQRIFLEAAWEALESAGHPPDGDLVLSVFAGSAAGGYSAALFHAHANRHGLRSAVEDLDLTVGGQPDFLTSRTAYKFGARGPALSLQTGCSSSLYAVHYATLSLLSGECDIALAGGATVVDPFRGYLHRPDEGVSQDGFCRSFSADSTGTAYSSGIGVVVLRRLADALADGDPVLAVLRGSAVGNDGRDRMGYVAPSPTGIADVVATALQVADVPAELIRYVAAHGTATPVGDNIELLALTKAFRRTTGKSGYCGLGSVITNIGHTGAAAGIASFIKAVHVARTGAIPPHPLFDRPRDPEVLADSPFFVTTSPQSCPDQDRHVLVNSLGVGGTNAAAVLAPPPEPTRPVAPARPVARLVLSARTRAELDEQSRRLADALERGGTAVPDVEYTLRTGRQAFAERRVVTAPPQALSAALRLPRPPQTRTAKSEPRQALVVLPPQGGAPAELVRRLLAALPGHTTTPVEPAEGDSPDLFTLLPAGGRPGPQRHAVDQAAELEEQLEEALTAAWLAGVTVDWEAHSRGAGRRVPLPTYPFTRKRYWALDRLAQDALAPAQPAPAQAGQAGQSAGPAGDELEQQLADLWSRTFGVEQVGPDQEFAALGGTSLLSVQLVLDIEREHGVLVNFQRAGGSQATVRKTAAIIRGLRAAGGEQVDDGPLDAEDSAFVDADLQLPLVPLAAGQAAGRDTLLTGATGYLGAFLLHELLRVTEGTVYCLVRAADEEAGGRRLAEAAARLGLPAPDPERVRVVPGDLRRVGEALAAYRDGELATRVRQVFHCAAKVVFTEPYKVLRQDNVLPTVELLNWMRGHAIRDFSFVSSLVATAPLDGGRVLETRDQPLDPELDAYGIGKWVCERLLERADADGMRVRVFRPGLIMAAAESGACNDKDLIWLTLASGLAVGAHPTDDRLHPVAPVDLVARAVVELGLAQNSVGRAYHLVDDRSVSLRGLFEQLAEAGVPTRPLPYPQWQQLVADEARRTGSSALAATALLELEGHEYPVDGIAARNWTPWLRRHRLTPAVSGEQLRRALAFLAERNPDLGSLLAGLSAAAPEPAGRTGAAVPDQDARDQAARDEEDETP